MFDKLFKRASTRARHVTAPFAEELIASSEATKPWHSDPGLIGFLRAL